MNKKLSFGLSLIALLVAGCQTNNSSPKTSSSEKTPISSSEVSSSEVSTSTSSSTIDAQSGKVLSSSAADTLRYPASLTKVMTLYITFDALEKGIIRMDDMLPVSRST